MTQWIDFVKKITKLPENKGLGLRHSLKQASKLWKKMKPSAGGKSASKSKCKKIQGGEDVVTSAVGTTDAAVGTTTPDAAGATGSAGAAGAAGAENTNATVVGTTGGRSKKRKCSKKCKTRRK